MIADTWSAHAVNVTVDGIIQTGTSGYHVNGSTRVAALAASLVASAQQSVDGKHVIVRVATLNATSVKLLLGGEAVVRVVKQTTISSTDAKAGNWPADPTAASPKESWLTLDTGKGKAANGVATARTVALPALSFTMFECPLQ